VKRDWLPRVADGNEGNLLAGHESRRSGSESRAPQPPFWRRSASLVDGIPGTDDGTDLTTSQPDLRCRTDPCR
jgi:hypothetical protein